jgi:hypothetical protein
MYHVMIPNVRNPNTISLNKKILNQTLNPEHILSIQKRRRVHLYSHLPFENYNSCRGSRYMLASIIHVLRFTYT